MRSIKIDRKKWFRGKIRSQDSVSYLWDSRERKGCCLGHAIHQACNRSWKSLDKLVDPNDVFHQQDILGLIEEVIVGSPFDGSDQIIYMRSDFTDRAISINDNMKISDKAREKRLIKLFRKNKIRLSFYD